MIRRHRAAWPWLAVAVCIPSIACAQADSAATTSSAGWRMKPRYAASATWDNNVFLLEPSKRDNMDRLSAAELASGRYTDMKSSNDLIPAFEAALDLRGRGFAGRRLTITPEARYELYTSNTRRSHARLGLALEQSLPKDGRLRLRERYTPAYFAKNYLFDAADEDSSRTIDPAERRYDAGTYAENETWLDWRVRLAKRRASGGMGAELELGAGYYLRTYDAPFAGRDLSGPMFAVTLGLDPGRRTALDLEYQLEVLSADPSAELLLIDESEFGLDFNGNGNATDLDVPSRQDVDRSRLEHSVRATFKLESSPRTDLEFHAGWRARAFSSDGAYDIGYRDRRDHRLEGGADFRARVRPGADLDVGVDFQRQTTNRAGDPGATGDEDDYSRLRLHGALTFRR